MRDIIFQFTHFNLSIVDEERLFKHRINRSDFEDFKQRRRTYPKRSDEEDS